MSSVNFIDEDLIIDESGDGFISSLVAAFAVATVVI